MHGESAGLILWYTDAICIKLLESFIKKHTVDQGTVQRRKIKDKVEVTGWQVGSK
jgi:hypothetical protein